MDSDGEPVARLRTALSVVRGDLAATMPEWSELQILVVPEEWNGFDVVAFVADQSGAYRSGGGPLLGSSSLWALITVAEGVQDLLWCRGAGGHDLALVGRLRRRAK